MKTIVSILIVIVFLGFCGHTSAQVQTGPPKRPTLHAPEADELTNMKDDLAKMVALLNQMQAVFPLVGNPTSPANHELQLNIEMWRILINQMQRRVDRMEQTQAGKPTG